MMLFFYIFLLSLQCLIVFGQDQDDNETTIYTPENYGKTWMYFPDGNDEPQIADLTNDTTASPRGVNSDDEIYFYLFTRKNQEVLSELKFESDDADEDEDDGSNENENEDEKMKKKNQSKDKDESQLPEKPFGNQLFDTNKMVKLITHGWRSSGQTATIINIKDGYLNMQDCNVIIIDWEQLANDIFYFRPVYKTRVVGKKTARLIDHLIINYGMSLDQFHVIGHSLGAHVAGYVGRFVKSGKIIRITGLDPAKPGFEDTSSTSDRLDKSDAQFVDIVHTCSGLLGVAKPAGHADFYPNGGTYPQPGCCNSMTTCVFKIFEGCSHARAHILFLESIYGGNFLSKKCDNMITRDDLNNMNETYCQGDENILGEYASPDVPGVFYLKTNSKPPYAQDCNNNDYEEKQTTEN